MIDALLDDLLAETAALCTVLDGLEDAAWDTPTPAPEWSVKDQIVHLAYFDDAQRQAIVDPDAFVATRAEALADVDAFVDRVTQAHRGLPPTEVRTWLGRARSDLAAATRAADPSVRVPWYGPSMTLASSVTARIMETWAHGQDVFDAVGAVHEPSDRLRHVAFLGQRAFANSFVARGRDVPDIAVRVELQAPDGGTWTFGDDGATEVVRGPAEDFCLVVTQRRHVDDTALVAEGAVAHEWLTIAQAYAGPPGAGRQPSP